MLIVATPIQHHTPPSPDWPKPQRGLDLRAHRSMLDRLRREPSGASSGCRMVVICERRHWLALRTGGRTCGSNWRHRPTRYGLGPFSGGLAASAVRSPAFGGCSPRRLFGTSSPSRVPRAYSSRLGLTTQFWAILTRT
jgi:hypothetical protein